MQGDGDNELIFGQDGGDTINGNGGNDVLYGGDGGDTITGGEGRDVLLGEEGNDTLISGVTTNNLVDSEDDQLEGGAGFDTYHVGNGDVITDSDGEGKVFFGDIELIGGRLSMDGQVYYSEDGQVIYTVLGGATPDMPTTLRVTTSAGTIEILEYYKDDLGILLRGEDGDDNGPPLPPRPQGGGDPQPMSPIALDLNGDGLQTTALQGGVYFDLDTDGFAEKIGYLNPNDGFLALDRNGDGLITSGSELFGNNTPMQNGSIAPNGYEALKSYDSNIDNLIDSNDAIYADLRVWRDADMDGISRESELHTLSELGVEAIGVSYTNSTLTDNGNELRQLGLYRTADGELRQTADIWFQTDAGDQLENKLPLMPDIMALPDTAAFGRAPSLRQAILADTSGELRTLVESLIQPGLDHNQRVALIEQMLFKMTGQQDEFGLNPENSLLLDVRIIGTLEAYYNQRLQDAMYPTGTGYLNWYSLRFEQLLNSTFYQIASQTFLSQYFDVMTFNYDADRNLVGTDFHQAITNVLNDGAANPAGANDLIFDFVRAVRGINPYEESVFDDFQADFAEVVAGGSWALELTSVFENAFETFPNTLGFASTIDTTDANDVLQGTFGNDYIRTYGGDDEIHGGRGIDTIDAGAGNDVLDGGMDRDTLTGGAGSDVYVWGRDYGQDEIIQTGNTATDADVIQFTADVAPADLRVSRWGGDIIIHINGTSDTLSIKNWFSPENHIASLQFSDSTVWTPGQVETFANTVTEYNDYVTGTSSDDVLQSLAGDDILVGGDGNDSLSGGAGNDHIQSDAGDDSLFGEAGDDRLYGGDGADILDGGAGNDTLDGGAGNDTYRFSRGSGIDSIENRFDNTDFDTIEMAADILPSDILVTRQNNDLVLTISGTQDVLRIRHWYYSPDFRVDRAVFNDGTVWNIAQLEAFINQGTAGDDIITGTASADTLDGLAGNDDISGLDGDDELHGNTGNDTLRGGTGNDLLLGEAGHDALHGDDGDDTLDGGAGNDQLYGGAGNDTYRFGRGAGQDYISESAGSGAETDTILIANDVLPGDVRVQRIHSGLRLVIRGTGDTLSINGWYNSPDYQVQQVVFGDGTVWTPAQLEAMAAVISDEDDYVFGDASDNTLSGLGGSDHVYGADGNDTLSGGAGNDYIQGDAGNDSLLGEAGNDTLYGSAGDDSLDGGEDDDQLRGEAGQDTLVGGAGNDTLYAGIENDVLQGGSGNDSLYGEHGNDSLTGGAGNDRLEGGTGSDTYYFGQGDGQDQIFENDPAGNIDTIRLTGVLPTDIDVTRMGELSFVLHIRSTGDQLTVLGGLSSGNHRVEQVVFDDGTTWDSAQLEALSALPTENNDTLWASQGNPLHGLGGNDYLIAHVTGSELHGDAGNDSLAGSSGADSLYGGSDDDALYGQGGDDLLDGGAGNDRLEGGTGNDNYRFGQGYGQDAIFDNDNTAFNQDSVILDASLTPADVQARFVNGQLTLVLNGSEDRLTLVRGIERVIFNDGTIWTQNDLYVQARTGSAGDDELQGSSGNDALDGLAGNDHVYGQDGDDTLYGGAGNDFIRGDAGNDTLDGQDGDDELSGSFGNDTIGGGLGNDRLYGHEGNDQLTGGEGSDSLYGEGGDDELDGNAGDDRLEGGSGNDIYRFGPGQGHDTIVDYSGSLDVIQMAEDVEPADILVRFIGNNLELRIRDTDDSILVQDWVSSQYRVEQVVFADGTIWDSSQIEALVDFGTEGDDSIYGTSNSDVINAKAGNDVIRANSGDDVVDGGSGNDSLLGENGNDILSGGDGVDNLSGSVGNDELDGGAGNDFLNGYVGSDLYHFSRGGGDDQIQEGWVQSGDIDTILVANDILASDVIVQRDGNNLRLSLTDGQGSMVIRDWYLNPNNQIEQVVFGDGTVWNASQLESIANTPTDGNDALYGTNGDDTIDALAGNDSVRGGDGNDTLTGGLGNDGVHGENGDDTLYGGAGDDLLRGGSGNDLLEGGDGLDQLYGEDGNDVLIGDGNDTLNGDAGNDSLTGGTGVNTLRGGEGSDTYHFGLGSGSDLIVEQDNTGSAVDTLQIGAGVAPVDIRVTRNEHSLTLSILNTIDAITVHNWYGSENNRVEQVVFQDGTVWNAEDLETMAAAPTDGNDVVYGNEGNDSINALAGNDTVYADAGNDVLLGGSGNDILHGEAGDDDLSGGSGDDTLYGGTGNDVYHHGRNEGFDWIVENDSTSGNADSIQFGADVLPGDVLVARSGNDLVVSIYGDAGALRISSWFTGSERQVEEIRFANGTIWTAAELEGRVGLLTEHDDSYVGSEGANTINGLGGNDTLVGNGGDDVLEGGDGDDELFGGNGSDILTGGAGNDDLQGGQGDDTYRFSSGDGQDTLLDKTGINTIEYAVGIAPADIVISRDGPNLYLNNSVTGDRLMMQQWFTGTPYQGLQVVFSDGTVWDQSEVTAMIPTTTGTQYDDYIVGPDSGATLTGLGGNDWLRAGSGDDILDGGAGIDTLNGGGGGDTYLFGYGSEEEGIFDAGDAGDVDKVQLGSGIGTDDVTFMRDSSVLYISLNGTGDLLTISNWFDGMPDYTIEQIVFADGTTWGAAEIENLIVARPGTEEDDEIYGGNGADNINGLGGNDNIYGGNGDDVVDGGSGDDYIEGQAGNDTLHGGAGSDEVYGGTGNDRYDFGLGSGYDMLFDEDGVDAVYFGPGIAPEDIQIGRWEEFPIYVELRVDGTDDVLALDWYGSEQHLIEQFIFDDGTVWNGADINPAYEGTEDADTLEGNYRGDVLLGFGGDDVIYGGAGDDVLDGGEDDDTLYGGAGGDLYMFREGDGSDVIYNNGLGRGSEDMILLEDILPGDITVGRDDQAMVISITGTDDQIVIDSWFSDWRNGYYRLGGVEFSDGTVWAAQTLENALVPAVGTEGDDDIYGGGAGETISGFGGYDRLYGGAGSDTLIGGLDGDELHGGSGNDTYIFSLGDGWDYIDERDMTPGNIDTLQFGAGILPGDVVVTREDAELYIEIGSEGLQINQWFEDEAYRIERFEFADGTVWDMENIENQIEVPMGTSDDEEIHGTSRNDLLFGAGGYDYLRGFLGDDVLIGGSGADEYEGGKGGDVYALNPGDVVSGEMEYIGDHYGEFPDLPNADSVSLGGGLRPSDIYAYLETGSEQWGEGEESSWSLLYLKLGANGGIVQIDWLSLYSDGQGYEENYDNRIERLQFIGLNDYQIFDLVGLVEERYDDLVDAWENETFIPLFTPETLTEFDVTATVSLAGGDAAENYALTGDPLTAPNIVTGTGGNETLSGTSGADALMGLEGNDSLNGLDGNDILDGGDGNDTLHAGAGNDRQYGGAGSDNLMGSAGMDLLDGGEGGDYAYYSSSDSAVQVDLGAETTSGGHAEGDVLLDIEHVWGSAWNDNINGDASSNYLLGASGNDTLSGGGGADGLYGGNGDDSLLGGEGNDTLYGEAGSDQLIGGYGDDGILGGTGSDVYRFGVGDDHDFITEDSGGVIDAGSTDLVAFFSDIAPDDLWFTREGDHLRVWVDGTDDWLQINNWYSNSAPGIEQFGTTEYLLLAGQVQQLVDAMAVFDPPNSGIMNIPQEARDEVAPVIATSWSYQGGPI